VRTSGWFPVVECASCEKSQSLCPFFPCFTDDDDKQGLGVFPWRDNFTLRSESLFMASLSSPKKQQRFVILLAPASNFLNGCPKRSRRLARYHLAMVLFQSPLAERGMTVSVSPRSPAVIPVAKGDK
jgi:hypothetical protein